MTKLSNPSRGLSSDSGPMNLEMSFLNLSFLLSESSMHKKVTSESRIHGYQHLVFCNKLFLCVIHFDAFLYSSAAAVDFENNDLFLAISVNYSGPVL